MPTLLVANRGEIARRIFRTARRMGLRTVAVHSDADANEPFVREADVAVRIGPPPATESYLNVDAVLEAAREAGADLVHPGYGFLAEDPRFARACEDAGFTFVGPPPGVLEAMGDKAEAKRTAEAAGVPVLPGYAGEDQSDARIVEAARGIGFPVLVKPAAGGGGKGMAVVRDPDDLEQTLASSRRVAQAAFGDDRLLLERYLERPRHVEVQILADHHGNVIHLGERDCSLQRRHQKILEESPSPGVDDVLREQLTAAAVALARHTGYRNAGTCEFLVSDDGTFGFIEMNARLQVEHPVTELVTGLDLVELQLRVAQGEPLPLEQDDVRPSGHAVEVRVYAEDPDEAFLPQTGTFEHLAWPPDVRIDTGVEEGSVVTPHYDPMVAKVVVGGPDRTAALWTLHEALAHTEILGVRTNLAFLHAVTQDPVVTEGKITTNWLEEAYRDWRSPREPAPALAVAAAAEAEATLEAARTPDPWTHLGSWRLGGPSPVLVVLRHGDEEIVVPVEGAGPFRVGDATVERQDDRHGWLVDGVRAAAAGAKDRRFVWHAHVQYEFAVGPAPRKAEEALTHLGSPLPGSVIAVRVNAGDHVKRGAELARVEAMKMEHAIKAPADGTVTAVLCSPGDQVDRDQPLVDFEPDA